MADPTESDGIYPDGARPQPDAESLLRLERIINALPHPMALLSPDLHYQAVNRAYSGLFDARNNSIIGRRPSDFFEEEFYRSTVRPRLECALTGETVRYDAQLPLPRGRSVWMQMEYRPSRNHHVRSREWRSMVWTSPRESGWRDG